MTDFKINFNIFLQNAGFSEGNIYLIAALVFALVISFIYFIKFFGTFIFVSLEEKFKNGNFSIWLNLFEKIKPSIILFNGLFFASIFIPLNQIIDDIILKLYIIISVIFAIDLIRAAIADTIKVYFTQRDNVSPEAVKNVVNFSNVTSTMILWLIVALFFLQFSQIDTKALISGLGIASIIVAFSFQKILSDIFAFFSIYVDKSFAVGDFIVFDKYSGTIKEIRIRTTKIKALSGHELIISNNQLINGVIENYNQLKKRRVSIEFLLPNNLNKLHIEKIMTEIKTLFEQEDFQKEAELVRVNFNEISNYGLNIRVIYYFKKSNFLLHLDFKEKVNLAIIDLINKNKVTLIQMPLLKATN